MVTKRITTKALAAATGMAASLIGVGTALAQVPPSSPTLSDKAGPPAWLGYLIMFLLFAMIIGVSLMPTKRTHQD